MHVPISSDAIRRSDRRRVAALACGIAPAGPYAATIEASRAARTREPLQAIALTIFAVHAVIVVALWHAWMPDTASTLPRALAVEVDASESARVAAPGVHRRVDVATPVPPPHVRSPASRETVTHREVRASVTASRQDGHAALSRVPAAATVVTKPGDEGPRTAQASAPAATGQTPTDAATVPAQAAPAAPSPAASEPVTAPRFAASYLHNPAPEYPDVAQRRGWEGTTFLNVHVLASGRPDQVLLSASSGHDALDDAAVAAVTDWRFVPAKRGAESIDGWVRVPVVFKLGN
nr:energy transducer TonB [Burkholderia ambifaria]